MINILNEVLQTFGLSATLDLLSKLKVYELPVEVFEFLHQHAADLDFSKLNFARYEETVKIFQISHNMRCSMAAYVGNSNLLKWFRKNDVPWDKWTCANAARGGHVEVLKWLRTNGCPWDENTCAFAAEGGHLEVLKWAHSMKCPYVKSMCAHHAINHPEVAAWIKENL